MSDVFHLGLKKADLQGATLAIVPGDPERVKRIAELLDNPVHLASHREFTTWRGEMDGKAVIICSTGIGGPSTSIAVEELAQLGIRTFLRIGTTGAIQPHLNVGDVIVTTGSVRLDGASLHFAPTEWARQNLLRDDRKDVIASTRAALDYLQQLHARFGDWHLALAAYNWGQGNVNRAITRNQRAGLPTGYADITMPAETRHYVPKLQAVKNIVARPQAFGATLPAIGNHPFFDTVTIERDMDVAVIARLAGISESDFRALNPSLKQPVVMAAGTPTVLLPWDNAVVFQQNLARHDGPLATWTAWVVPSTMTVAQAAGKLGMSESELRSVNNIPPRMQVRAGSSLLVHRTGARDRDVPEHVADNAMLSLQPDVVLRRTTVKARQGDTLASLARRYKVPVSSVAEWNKLSAGASLKAGQSITLMLPQRAAVAKAGGTRKKAATRTARTQAKGKTATASSRKAAPARTRVAAGKP